MKTQTISSAKLIGLALPHKTTNENGQSAVDCGNLWQQFEREKYFDKIPQKLGSDIYAVYYGYEGDHMQPFSYFIGCKVEADAQPAEGLTSIHIPEGKFVKRTAKGQMPQCIGQAWMAIWQEDLPRAFEYDFEVYDERSSNWSDAEVDIYLSV